MGVYEDRARRSLAKIVREEEEVAEAVFNCQEGLFNPEGEAGLAELLKFLRYSTDDTENQFDPDRLFELSREHGVSEETVRAWIIQAESAGAKKVESE
jgi:hypothetical protein